MSGPGFIARTGYALGRLVVSWGLGGFAQEEEQPTVVPLELLDHWPTPGFALQLRAPQIAYNLLLGLPVEYVRPLFADDRPGRPTVLSAIIVGGDGRLRVEPVRSTARWPRPKLLGARVAAVELVERPTRSSVATPAPRIVSAKKG